MMGAHRSIPLLSSTIPNLKPAHFPLNFLIDILEIYSNGWVSVIFELIIDQSPNDGTFSNIHITKQTHLNILVDVFVVSFVDLFEEGDVYGCFSSFMASRTYLILFVGQAFCAVCVSAGEY